MNATSSRRTVRHRTRALAPVLATLLAAATPVSAQTETEPRPGQVVRVSTVATKGSPARRIMGEYAGVSGDTLRLESRGRHWAAIPLRDIARLEVQRGKRSGVGRGARIGGLVGAGTGFVLGLAAAADPCEGFECVADPGPAVIPFAMLGLGAVGAGVGALIGAASPRRDWEEVPRAGFAPQVSLGAGRVGVGVTLTF